MRGPGRDRKYRGRMSFLSAPDGGDANTAFAPAAAGGSGLAVPDAAPLVDPAALQDLGAQLESPAVAKGFARDYTKMWDQRYHALASALERGDPPARWTRC